MADLFYMYPMINFYNANRSPSTVHCQNTELSIFFAKYLLEKTFGNYVFTLPNNWDLDYFRYTLFINGIIAPIKTRSFGIIPQDCTLGGLNVQYRPTTAYITNPLIGNSIAAEIGVHTEIIRIQPDYSGIMDLISFFADNMAITAETAGVNTLNSKLSFLFMTDTKSNAETFKKIYDDYASGQPATFAGNKDLFGVNGDNAKYDLFTQDVGKNYIVDKLQTTLRQWELMYCNYVGIPNNPIEKKERVNVAEVESNNVETEVLADLWLETITKSFEKVNDLFGINCRVRLKYPRDKGGDDSAKKSMDRHTYNV